MIVTNRTINITNTHKVGSQIARHYGMTLLSLLIGLNIAMLSVLASLQLYTTHWLSTEEMKVSSKHSRQLSSVFVVLEKQLMAAGYGIENADVNDVVVQEVAASLGLSATTSLYWRYFDGAMVCRGVRETSELLNGQEYRTLTLLTPSANCNDTTNLVDMPWDVNEGVLGNWLVADELQTYITANGNLFDFQINVADCAPFRIVNAVSHLMVTVTAPTSAELNGMTGVPGNSTDICLMNMITTL